MGSPLQSVILVLSLLKLLSRVSGGLVPVELPDNMIVGRLS